MTKRYVAVLECSAGNDTVGDMWYRTLICRYDTTVKELVKWQKDKRGMGKLVVTVADVLKEEGKEVK